MTQLDDYTLGPGVTVHSLYFAKHPDVDLSNCTGRDVNAIGAELPRA